MYKKTTVVLIAFIFTIFLTIISRADEPHYFKKGELIKYNGEEVMIITFDNYKNILKLDTNHYYEKKLTEKLKAEKKEVELTLKSKEAEVDNMRKAFRSSKESLSILAEGNQQCEADSERCSYQLRWSLGALSTTAVIILVLLL